VEATPELDACGGHFGLTPDSLGEVIYHHHVQEKPPFTYGCYGPAADVSGKGRPVSNGECRALYSECGNGDQIDVTTAEGTYKYDPWCPCFDAAGSNAGDVLTPPSPPPPSIAVLYPGCTATHLQTDLDGNGRATLGDAVFVANARLEYGTTGVNPMECLEGDYDGDGSFTLNDAAQVAMAIFGKAKLPWTDQFPIGSRMFRVK